MTQHFLLVGLRSGDNWCVPQASLEDARATVLFAAAVWLRKCPQDRSGVWCVASKGSTLIVDDAGVGEKPVVDMIAAFDPREVAAVQVVSREVEETAWASPWRGFGLAVSRCCARREPPTRAS